MGDDRADAVRFVDDLEEASDDGMAGVSTCGGEEAEDMAENNLTQQMHVSKYGPT